MYNRDSERQQYEDWHRYGRERGWMHRATDEVRSWFGDGEAERRRRMDQMEREHGDRGERSHHGEHQDDERMANSRPSWQDRHYSGISPRGYDVEERGRFGMEGHARRERANREHWSYGGNASDYDYGTEYGGGQYGRDRNRTFERNRDSGRERDFESGMGYGQGYGSGMGMMANRRDFDDERSMDRPRTRLGGENRGTMFGSRDDESMYRSGGRGNMFGGMHSGRGPRNFQRSDERISDELHQVLTFHPEIDASDIDILVEKGVVTLRGKVEDRRSKRLAEDLCEEIYGVREVRNELRTEHGLFGKQGEEKPNEQQRNNSLLSR